MTRHEGSMRLIATKTAWPEVMILEPQAFHDERGYFLESFNQRAFREATGCEDLFVQDNQSRSIRGVLRGLHFQHAPHAQGKLVRVLRGTIFDVVADIRPASPTHGEWLGIELSEDNGRQLWIPPGFAHGYLVLSETADVHYKVNRYHAPAHEGVLAWNDPALGIEWPIHTPPILSSKDARGQRLSEIARTPA